METAACRSRLEHENEPGLGDLGDGIDQLPSRRTVTSAAAREIAIPDVVFNGLESHSRLPLAASSANSVGEEVSPWRLAP